MFREPIIKHGITQGGTDLKVIKKLPPDRTYEQLKNHYLVEKSIAERIKKSTREERMNIYATMYDELFRKVPDHPRLTQSRSDELTVFANRVKFSIVGKFLGKSCVFAEFAPGDCRFAYEVARRVEKVYAIDISDQRNPVDQSPENFEFILYDGYSLDTIADSSIDIAFSDQLIEHFHPEDTRHHFETVYRILKKGGRYIFRTPHWLIGPHDVSYYFSYEPECFHLKEWTYREIKKMIDELGYTAFHTYWNYKDSSYRVPYGYFVFWETLLGPMPKRYFQRISYKVVPSLAAAAIK